MGKATDIRLCRLQFETQQIDYRTPLQFGGRIVDHVVLFDVNAEGDKSLKAKASRRLVPIHSELVHCGFLRHVQSVRDAGHDRLFPDLSRNAMGKWSGSWSKWWSRYQRSMGITDKRKVFHSFRHRFRDALRDARVPEDVANRLMGHTDPSMGGRYGRGFNVEVLAEEVNKIEYPGLDLGHLRPG